MNIQNPANMNPYATDFYNDIYIDGTRASANEIVKVVCPLIKPLSVVDVGCGIGLFLEAFSNMGVKQVCGIDGSWVRPEQLHIKKTDFISRDLTKPILLERKFDLVVCLEVAEHLPSEAAPTLVQSLVRLGPVILFSAAIPEQGGVSHLNEQWPEYWTALFSQRGYLPVDCVRQRIWNVENVLWWYAQNTILFVDKDYLRGNTYLNSEFERTSGMPLSLVHPRAFLHYRKQDASLQSDVSFKELFSLTKRWATRRFTKPH